MTVTAVNGYTLADAIEFSRTIRQDPGKVFDFDGTRALKALAAAKERRRFDRIVDVAIDNSSHPNILARLEFRCIQADHGYLGARSWNEIVPPPAGPTQTYFQKKYGTPYEDMIKERKGR